MAYCVVVINGKQYKVSKSDEVLVDHLEGEAGKQVEFDQVLLKVSGEEVKVGTPFLENEKVKAEVVNQIKGDKLRVFRFKSKSRYRKTRGFRHSLTKLKIT